jgi:hypothetical protein
MQRAPLALRHVALSLSLALFSASTSLAGGSGENVYLIVDPTNPESMYVANYYKTKRDIPDVNVLYMSPLASSYPAFAQSNLQGFLGSLANKRIEDHVDFVILPSGGSFYTSAPGLVHDSCWPVSRLAAPAGYTLAFRAADILDGINSISVNRYSKFSWEPQYFDSNLGWLNGDPSTASNAKRYFIGAMLGYTGGLGNTLAEVLAMIDRSVAVDATRPAGTFYFMETADPARSGPRDGAYPEAVNQIVAAGGAAQHLFDWLPLGHHDCLGVMTGLAVADIDGADMVLLPGSFADHLTSYAATFDEGSQTKMSRWIAKGASGSAGTVEEPCNYPGKFPHARIHVIYFKGLTLGESWFRSVGFEPFQDFFLGDPLTRPFSWPPFVDVIDAPGETVSGTITLTPIASATAPGAAIDYLELHVDGVLQQTIEAGGAFTLDTGSLDDGWHELRVMAFDDTLVRNSATWVGNLTTNNDARTVTVSVGPSAGDLGQRFDFVVSAGGGPLSEVLLMQNDRVVASTTNAFDTLGVYGQMLGAGDVRLQAVAVYTDGTRARSNPVALSIAYSGGSTGTPPLAFGFTKRVRFDDAFVLELPATYNDSLAAAVYTVVTLPAQATILSSGIGPWRAIQPNVGAAGTDTLVFHVTTAAGTSADATIVLVYDCATERYCKTAPNSAGPGAIIATTGTTSIAANDFGLEASGMPANQFGLFYYGKNPIELPFGNGFRCIGGAIARFPIQMTDAFGYAYQTIDNEDPPSQNLPFEAGTSLCFQFWYRDPQGGGAAFNLSDAVRVTFCP